MNAEGAGAGAGEPGIKSPGALCSEFLGAGARNTPDGRTTATRPLFVATPTLLAFAAAVAAVAAAVAAVADATAPTADAGAVTIAGS